VSTTGTALVALAIAAATAYVLAPVAIAVARRTNFLDRPVGYKGHQEPTPYLGGATVGLALLLATAVLADVDARLTAILGCAGGLALLGAVDDRWSVSPRRRIAAELVATSVLFVNGVHWALFGEPVLDFALTALWIVDATNLMDNMDGTAATVVGVSGAGIGALALINGRSAIAITSFALTGGCLGFLPRNLARPARLFLGDGGSMPLGFLIAALAMSSGPRSGVAFLVGAMLVGLPILDTTLVSVSRVRRGLTVVTAGRDHLTHRLLGRVGSPRKVCFVLFAAQGLLVLLALVSDQAGQAAVILTAGVLAAAGIATMVLLDSPASRRALEGAASSRP
jgi:UDP-GlcNAc:undecaprenyl-phosphate GlcNAc-1-phosphate transferase